MNQATYVQLLNLAAGAFLLTAVLVLWRRDLVHIIRLFALQGAFLAGIVAIVAVHDGSVELGVLAAGILALRAVVLPVIVHRALGSGTQARETRPLVNVAVSLLVGAGLTLLAYAVSAPLVALAPGPAAQAIPTGITVVLIGFFVLVTRRRAVSQIVGFLLIDNGITTTAFLTTAGVPLVVELAVSLDVLFIVLVLQLLAGRIRSTFGDTDLDELKELRDS
ncbi:hypothetical protein [Flindersiella endophytica]